MCSTSKVNEVLAGLSNNPTTTTAVAMPSSVIPSIPAHIIKQHRDQYILVDVREAAELVDDDDEGGEECEVDGHATLGSIVHDARGLLNSHVSLQDKTMVKYSLHDGIETCIEITTNKSATM